MPAKKQATAPDPISAALGGEFGDTLRDLAQSKLLEHAVQHAEPLGETGPLRGEKNGMVVLELNDQVIRFRVPTYDEFQILSEMETPGTDEALDWWRFLAEGGTDNQGRTMAGLGDSPLPDRGSLPIWLANPVNCRQALNHWVLRPTQAPGT